jgi:hypothetical protein
MHYTPTYSSWLNQVELGFNKVERDVIARGVFTSMPDLNWKLMRYIRTQAMEADFFSLQYLYKAGYDGRCDTSSEHCCSGIQRQTFSPTPSAAEGIAAMQTIRKAEQYQVEAGDTLRGPTYRVDRDRWADSNTRQDSSSFSRHGFLDR